MKDLWPDVHIHDYQGELGNLATLLHRPVLQDLTNVIVLMSNPNVSEFYVIKRISRALMQEGPFLRGEARDDSSIKFCAYLHVAYTLQLVKEVRERVDPLINIFPPGATIDDVEAYFGVSTLDDLARVIGNMFGFVTDDIEHPWEAFSVPSLTDVHTSKSIAFWL